MTKFPDHDDNYFMSLARGQAEISFRQNGIPVGAVLAVPGTEKPLAAGHNRRNQERNRILHGEMSCLRDRALEPIPEEATLYTTLNPCAMCAGAIRQFGIRRVVIGQEAISNPSAAAFAGEAKELESLGIEVVILHDVECEKLFSEFLSTPWGLDAWLGDIGKA
jgi:cytosine deaminase